MWMVKEHQLTDCEPQTERDVSNGVDAPVDGRVPDVHQEPQLGHHGGVHHPDPEAQAGHGDDQVVGAGGEGNLLRCI